jgi:hypothetical protein
VEEKKVSEVIISATAGSDICYVYACVFHSNAFGIVLQSSVIFFQSSGPPQTSLLDQRN